jgi:hypothetical protein
MAKYITISELHMDDKVIPLSSNIKESDKEFIVSDLHPCNMNSSREYKTVAVTLWDGNREFTSRTTMFKLIERRWGN